MRKEKFAYLYTEYKRGLKWWNVDTSREDGLLYRPSNRISQYTKQDLLDSGIFVWGYIYKQFGGVRCTGIHDIKLELNKQHNHYLKYCNLWISYKDGHYADTNIHLATYETPNIFNENKMDVHTYMDGYDVWVDGLLIKDVVNKVFELGEYDVDKLIEMKLELHKQAEWYDSVGRYL